MTADSVEPFIKEAVPSALSGERVDRIVALLTGASRSAAVHAVDAGLVSVNSAVVTRSSVKLREGDVITIAEDPVVPESAPTADSDVDFGLIYEDTDVLVVDKPAGLVVHPAPGHAGATLVNGLLARFPDIAGVGGDEVRPGIVHRLDRGTSGLLVVARNDRAHRDLVSQLSTHAVGRTYTALTWGRFEHPQGVIDAPIGRSRRDPLRMTVAMDGRPSRTHYSVEDEYVDPIEATLVTCRLETGRTHQIRVHLASIGNPVVGDPTYGGGRPRQVIARPFLHARELTFIHPTEHRSVSFESPLPADLADYLNGLS